MAAVIALCLSGILLIGLAGYLLFSPRIRDEGEVIPSEDSKDEDTEDGPWDTAPTYAVSFSVYHSSTYEDLLSYVTVSLSKTSAKEGERVDFSVAKKSACPYSFEVMWVFWHGDSSYTEVSELNVGRPHSYSGIFGTLTVSGFDGYFIMGKGALEIQVAMS